MTKAMPLKAKQRDLPDNITIPGYEGYQVRISRGGYEYSATFAWSAYGSAEAALSQAVAWRDRLLAALPPPGNGKDGFRTKPMRTKTSYGRVGITRYFKKDRRRVGEPRYLVFGVNFTDNDGYPRVKQFQAGKAEEVTWDQELHAALTAEAFRTHWEFCKLTGKAFGPEDYKGWGEKVLYPFNP